MSFFKETEDAFAFDVKSESGFIESAYFVNDYDNADAGFSKLYSKAKINQWDAVTRIDWSQDLDPENPMEVDDRGIPIYGSEIWARLTPKEKAQVRHHVQASMISQFRHGEQGALIAASKIVQIAPDMSAKMFAATQVMDESRHLEVYSRLLSEKFELSYPITPALKTLLQTGLSDSRWDMVYLTTQILIEGFALVLFQQLRDLALNPLASQINAYVMQDEARHVGFGRLALRGYYPHLSDAERDEREEFVLEACNCISERVEQRQVWERLGLPVKECLEIAGRSEGMLHFRTQLFMRIVPTLKDIGLWGPRIRKRFADMGVLAFEKVNIDVVLESDEMQARSYNLAVRKQMAQLARARLTKPAIKA